MIGPVILPLDSAVSAVAASSAHIQLHELMTQAAPLNHVHVFNIARAASGLLAASHASHASHSSHVSSSLPGGGVDDSGSSTSVTYSPPSAPSWVYATSGNGFATVSWSPVYSDDGGSVTYVITAYPGGASLTVVNLTTATLVGLQNGVTYSFTVTAANTVGRGPASAASGGTTPTAPMLGAHRPTISGEVAVHQKLEVETPGWDSGTTFSYQWFADGQRISGATNRNLTVTAGLKSKKLTVAVVGAKPGYVSPAAISSAATHKVAIAAVPKLHGTAVPGKTLRASTGRWTDGTTFSYRWFVDGKRIAGDSSATLTLKPKYTGKDITVQVTGIKAGYGKVTLTSTAHKVRS